MFTLGTDDPSDGGILSGVKSDSDSDYDTPVHREVHLIKYSELADLTRDLCLTKQQAELLGSRLQEWNLLAPNTRTTIFRHRHKEIVNYFAMEDNLCFCKDANGLMLQLGHVHIHCEWRLFIDSSKTSLKAVLLHNGNLFSSIPVAYSTTLKETYDNMAVLLEKLNYNSYNWPIYGDLKFIALLMGMQLGYTKFMCFL
jgi:hypothetical protein